MCPIVTVPSTGSSSTVPYCPIMSTVLYVMCPIVTVPSTGSSSTVPYCPIMSTVLYVMCPIVTPIYCCPNVISCLLCMLCVLL